MQTKIILIVLFCVCSALSAQDIHFSEKDKMLFESHIQSFSTLNVDAMHETLVRIGKHFLGTTYTEKTLEVGNKEALVINLRGFDCTTYVENVLAFSNLVSTNKTGFNDFKSGLEHIRYRDGILDGYASRLHYFTDWIRNNEKKGLVKDITASLGGEIIDKPINFMGTHRDLYPFLKKDDVNYQAILKVEKELAEESLCVLLQDQIKASEVMIQSGDIIALATSIKGLDVTHTGFALKKEGRVYLLHASSSGEVTITKEPLVEYLKKIKHNTGIIVARPIKQF